MKRALLCVAVAVIVVVAAFFGVVGVASAERLPQQYVTANYYDLGDIYAVSAYRDTVAVLRAKDGAAYLTVMGERHADIALSSRGVDADNLADVQFAFYDGMALLRIGDTLCVCDCATGIWRDTYIPATYTVLFSPLALTGFAIDETGMLYLRYQIMLVSVQFDENLFVDEDLVVRNSSGLQNDSDTPFEAHDGVCYFYLPSGTVYSVDMRPDSDRGRTKEWDCSIDAYAYAGKDLLLREGTLASADATVARCDETHVGDRYLVDATAVCTSYYEGTWRVWVVDRGQSAVKAYDAELNYLYMCGAYGSDDGRLHSPTEIARDKMIVVNDAGNRRVVVLRDGAYIHIDGEATAVATAGDRAYVARETEVMCYDFARATGSAPYFVTSYSLPYEVLSVCVDGNAVYALTRAGVYAVAMPDVPVIAGDAKRVKAGRHAGILYVQTAYAIAEYKDNESLNVAIDVSALDVVDFDADYCGNVYVLTADHVLHTYLRLPSGYEEGAAYTTDLSALSILADGSVYGLSAHAVVKVPLEVRDVDNSAYDDPDWDDTVAVVKMTETVWGYACPNNYESMVKVPVGTYAMLMAKHTYLDVEYYYVEFALRVGQVVRNEKVYVPCTAATTVPYTEPQNTYVRYAGLDDFTGVFAYPSYSASALFTVPRAEATFQVLREMGVENGELVWHWYMVSYNGSIGYVDADNYVDANPPYREVERYYARCVTGKLGEKVSVYAAPDVNSEVVTTLVDGTKIELVAPFDPDSEFTCVRIDDREVYILTANVTDRALTNGQTFALVMGVVIICAAVLTLILYFLAKKTR